LKQPAKADVATNAPASRAPRQAFRAAITLLLAKICLIRRLLGSQPGGLAICIDQKYKKSRASPLEKRKQLETCG
jgi:hypothetical protein